MKVQFHPQHTNVKVEGPSFPTGRASQFLAIQILLKPFFGFSRYEALDPSGTYAFLGVARAFSMLRRNTFLFFGVALT